MAKHSVTAFLRAFENFGEIFFSVETDLLVVLDEVGNISRVNAAFERALDRTEASVLGHELIRYVAEDDLAEFIRSFAATQSPAAVKLLKRVEGEVRVKLIAYKFKRSNDGLRGYLVLRPE